MITVDYTVVPAIFDLLPLDGYDMFEEDHDDDSPQVCRTENQLGRSINLLERARDNKEKCTLLKSKIVNGNRHYQAVVTMVTENFWYANPGARCDCCEEEMGDEGFWSLTRRS